METLESSRMCRLCGQQSGISINIFDESENHVKKINAVLPIMVHEMDLLPKQMCHRCSYKLEEFHKFYVDCLKTDATLKSQLSWMRKDRDKEKIGVPMVHIENMKIKAESLDYDVYELEPLIENMEYINSMALPAGGIHNGLTYATLSRYRCCCDKKDQSRAKKTTAGFCQNYRESIFKCGEIANDSRKRTLVDATPKLRPMKKNTFTQAEFPDCPQNHLLCVDAVENAQDRLTADTNTKDASSLNTRNCSYDKLETIPKNPAVSRSTIVRNLRPRINLVNYASNKKTIVHNLRPRNTLVNYTSKKRKTSIDANSGPSIIASNSEISNSKATFASNFKLTRQIKVEQIDEMEGRSLRPRRTVVDYQEPKMRKVSDHRTKRRKMEDAEQNSKPHSKNENASSNKFVLKLKIKQEVLDDLEDTVLSEMTNAIPRLPNNSLANLPAKVEAVTSDNDVSSRDDMSDYFKSNHPQLRNKFQLAKQKSLSNIMKNKLTKTKKIYRLPAANYSPKCLRSQDAFLRNGKARKKDYIEWPVKKLQTRKLMDMVNKSTKPAVVKLAETIKHYCETCNVSFANKELFKLHRCYYD
ncbi:hypothetical protein EAG_08952 [Camponotus floridanus]|uniref:ZAD domain-containing protein n=1 Tax=Camponotus floridanus TaxID=104421 RepID=E2AUL1_CAMFO|nr:uncharacterized protein LOC105256179 [Camponotus floridanus]EFN62858.1 hypothetical protein EAG_08952 [Camponotus floridanus]